MARRRARGAARFLVPALAAIAAAAVGGWLDWRFWNPTYGVQILALVATLLAVLFAAVLRRRVPALLPIATGAAVGLSAGMAFGPSREELLFSTGTVQVSIERPTVAAGTMSASCSTSESGEQVAITAGDSGDALRIGRAHEMTLSLDRGDMYAFEVAGRPDQLGLLVLVRRIGAVTMADGPTETRLGSTEVTRLESSGTQLEGTLAFEGLALHPASEAAELVDLTGRISWSCSPPVARP